MFPVSWLKLQRSFQDFTIDYLAHTQRELAQKPFISILLNPNEISETNLQLMMDSIYSQEFICFEVIVPEKLFNMLSKKIESSKHPCSFGT